MSCKEDGQPFVSKHASEMINRLQKHNFQWEDESYEELCEKYQNCKSALQWWCNKKNKDLKSSFNISWNKYLKEFMIKYPPTFKISAKCCDGAKKNVSKNVIKNNNFELKIMGIRKAEGGIRSVSYKSCFTQDWGNDTYLPIFWYKDADKKEYEKHFNIVHSACYTEYGFLRTGCAACPYGGMKECNKELKVLKKYEPNLYKACHNIFKDSYEYMRAYEDFKKEMENKSNV